MKDRIAHYDIGERLGEGGMGVVYKARDTHLDRFVAIKVLPPAKVANPERKRRFVQEAKSASALNHPNIITVHDIDQQDGVDFIVMEYLPGTTLEKLIPSQGMRLNEVLEYSAQIAGALAKAHAAGIVHRDLKPGNIMVSDDGLGKVLDFGLAKLTEMDPPGDDEATRTLQVEGGPHTEEGAILGTVSYMSPEQAEGRKVDARSDIFAFGLVLYEMVTGQRAFSRDSKMSTLAAILKEEPKAVREVAEGIPSELERIINRCLRKDPNRRFMQIGEVKLALEELKEESESGKLAPEVGSGVPKTSPTGRPKPAVAAVVALVLAAAVVTYLFVARESPLPGSNLTIRPLTSFEGEEAHPAWNPDGSLMAYAHNAHGSADIFVIPAGGGTPLRLTDHPADDLMPSWSPDGRYIAFLSDRGTGSDVYLIPRPIGVERKLTDTGLRRDLAINNGLGSQPWSPDGRELLFPRLQPDGGVAVWKINLATSDETQVTFPPPRGWNWDASWSFDGKSIAFEGKRDGKTGVWVMPAAGGEPRLLSEGGKWPVWSPDSRRVVFSSDRSSEENLWEVEIGSGQLRQLTSGPGDDWYPVVAANGALAYEHFGHQLDLFSMQLESGEEERLTSHVGTNRNARVSPNGTRIVYHSDRTGDPEVWLLDLEKKTERQLTDDPAGDGHPDWSPDGREIVFLSNRDGERHLWVVGADGGPSRRLTRRSIPSSLTEGFQSAWNIAPRWSPDGRAVGYLAPAEGGMALWVVDGEGTAVQSRLSGVPFSFDWYRDSRHVIYTRMAVDASGTREMCAANLDTGEETTLYRGLHTELAVAPDGRSVTFCNSASHYNQNLFLLRLAPPPSEGGLPRPLGEAQQLTDGKGIWHVHNGGWSPDGESVVYTRDTDHGDIYVIENYR